MIGNIQILMEKSIFCRLKGKGCFSNYWATWCPPCVAEFSAIDQLYQQYKNDVAFVLLSNEAKEK